MATKRRRAATSRVTRLVRFRSWSSHHAGCMGDSILRLLRTPLSSILTMAVLGIALALPGGLYILSQNMLSLGTHWDTDTQLTLYLTRDTTDEDGQLLARQLQSDNRFSQVSFLSRDQALAEFRQMTAFQNALEHVAENPLPAVILLNPASQLDTAQLEQLRQTLLDKPEVELAQLDLEWIKRMHGIIQIIQRAILIVAIILAIAVVLVVGNTIRLEIENRRDEIVITKLFGATHGYIRRPFLYDGLWYGLMGGLFASALIIAAMWLLSEPVFRLINLYQSDFTPVFPGILFITGIAITGALLGYLGAWSAVSQHLYKIEPE